MLNKERIFFVVVSKWTMLRPFQSQIKITLCSFHPMRLKFHIRNSKLKRNRREEKNEREKSDAKPVFTVREEDDQRCGRVSYYYYYYYYCRLFVACFSFHYRIFKLEICVDLWFSWSFFSSFSPVSLRHFVCLYLSHINIPYEEPFCLWEDEAANFLFVTQKR